MVRVQSMLSAHTLHIHVQLCAIARVTHDSPELTSMPDTARCDGVKRACPIAPEYIAMPE